MAKATIIEDLGSGQYTIERNWAGRDKVQERIDAFRAEADLLETRWEGMPQTTDDELFEKNIVQMQFTALRTKSNYLENNMPVDAEVDAWCTDYTEGLTGEVGTIDIAGEFTSDVNIRPGSIESNAYSGERDGELYPAIALGPWTSLLNQMIYPGWQRFAPLHRYATIIEDSIDYENNTCAVAVQPTFSLMNYYVNRPATGGGEPSAASGIRSNRIKNYNVNLGDILGQEEIEVVLQGVTQTGKAIEFFIQSQTYAHPGFVDFVERNPTHPISNIGELSPPVFITDEQFVQLARICRFFDYFYKYGTDRSGYEIGDFWNVMYNIGDPWYWTPSYAGEAQTEFTFGDITLEYDESGSIVGPPSAGIEAYHQFGTYLPENVELQFAANQLNVIGPKQRRLGDCEDFVLTKMQAIIESGIIPKENLQVLLCYVLGAGYHAVLGIQTTNRGFLISDQRDYGQLWEIEQLRLTHKWDRMSVSTV